VRASPPSETFDGPKALSEETVNVNVIPWKQILLTALVTGLVTIGTGMILYWLQQRQPRLEYVLEGSVPFEGQNETLVIYQLKITNNGRSAVARVGAYIVLPPGQLRQVHVRAQPGLEYQETLAPDKYSLSIASLNPDETILLSVLTGGKQSIPAEPQVVLRGDGVTGARAPRVSGNPSSALSLITNALIGAYTGLLTVWLLLRRSRLRRLRTGEQRQNLAFLCGVHGLTDDLLRHTSDSGTSYWLEAERLTALALADPQTIDARLAVLKDMVIYPSNMAPRSKAIVYYCIARLAFAKGDANTVETALREAIRLDKDLVRRRSTVDKLFEDRIKAALSG
jgi:hypothetical protein